MEIEIDGHSYDVVEMFGAQENGNGELRVFAKSGALISVATKDTKLNPANPKLIALRKGAYATQ